jgi:hypothetical protein
LRFTVVARETFLAAVLTFLEGALRAAYVNVKSFSHDEIEFSRTHVFINLHRSVATKKRAPFGIRRNKCELSRRLANLSWRGITGWSVCCDVVVTVMGGEVGAFLLRVACRNKQPLGGWSI